MAKAHHFNTSIHWTGNKGQGTASYDSYERSHTLNISGKAPIQLTSAEAFRGAPGIHNPEDIFLASLSSCHMLWYLHLCATNQVVVTAYEDHATGIMEMQPDGSGAFTSVVLHPAVTVASPDMVTLANTLHEQANKMCFIANSCNFPISHQPICKAEG